MTQRAPDRVMYVSVGDGAHMVVPLQSWLYELCHVRPEPDRGTLCDDRLLAVGALESYLYLIDACTKEEAWSRIKLMRAAVRGRARADGESTPKAKECGDAEKA